MGAEKQSELRPICFMVMPFRIKKVTGPTAPGAPTEVNFDALWDKAFRPAIEKAGYTPIRADFDTGTVIIKDMLERLAFADLVIADASLPNGNVYYEIGLRHVARETGCIMVAASWSQQLFDIEQFTSVRYDLGDGDVPDAEAASIGETVYKAIDSLKNSRTPWHEFIADAARDGGRRGVFREFAEKLSAFQAELRAVRLTHDKDARKEKVDALRLAVPPTALEISEVALEMVFLVRDELGWDRLLDFANSLPKGVAKIPVIEEQRLLALANTGQPEEAIARLEELIKLHGESPERLGLIGGRYKRLWRDERDARVKAGGERASRDERRLLNKAIDYYTRGMQLDYNQFYCSCNIPQLLFARGEDGDAERAVIVDYLVVAACERAIARDEDDEWTRPTLLGAAFRSRDVGKARELSKRIDEEGVDAWKLDSTISDLEDAAMRAAATPEGAALKDICEDLRELLSELGG